MSAEWVVGVTREDVEQVILARLEKKSDHMYQWPRWAAAYETSCAVADLLNIAPLVKPEDAR